MSAALRPLSGWLGLSPQLGRLRRVPVRPDGGCESVEHRGDLSLDLDLEVPVAGLAF
jgi:hypothetical protein